VIAHTGPTLEVNLSAIARNYALIQAELKKGKAAAVVKANAYGLGAASIAPALYDAGCRDFFVATLDEALELRTELDDDVEPRAILPEANIYVFHGARKQQRKDFLAHRLTPVLNSTEQIRNWGDAGAWALHIDTGMNRLGVSLSEAESLEPAPRNLQLIMSHLACASEPDHPKNKEQLTLFQEILLHFPGISASFANSSGVFLGPEYHFDIARPGRALYGITRGTKTPANMENVVTLSAPVLRYRTVDTSQTVGYGATAKVEKGTVLATVEIGYADGFLRALGSKAYGYAGNVRLPIVGLVSMDMVVVDVTAVPAHLREPELRITFIGKEQPIDTVADMAGTIGYEIFTRLGARVKRIYT
jgi:alanine racemase